MPVAEGGRFRVKKTPNGTKIRLHFTKSGTVDEAKTLPRAATPAKRRAVRMG